MKKDFLKSLSKSPSGVLEAGFECHKSKLTKFLAIVVILDICFHNLCRTNVKHGQANFAGLCGSDS